MEINEENIQNYKIGVHKNITDLCRSCLSGGSLNNIFELQFEELPFSLIFSELLGTSISQKDNLPKNLCNDCIGEIARFFQFKRNFIKSQRVLKSLYSKRKVWTHVMTAPLEIKEEVSNEDVEEHVLELKPEEIIGKSESGGDIEFVEVSDEIQNEKTDNKLAIRNNIVSTGGLLEKRILCNGCNKAFNILQIKKHTCSVCYICKKDFKMTARLRTHMNSHTNARPYMCEYCGRGFNSSSQLMRHKRVHTGEKPYECKLCGKRFRVSFARVEHMRGVHLNTQRRRTIHACQFCGETFTNYIKRSRHIAMNHSVKKTKPKQEKPEEKKINPVNPERYLCEICSKTYKTIQQLQTHLLSHGERKYQCSICDKKFANKTILNGHVLIHSEEKNCVCQYCGKGFKYSSLLRGHLYIHTGKNYKFKCEICDKKLPTNHKLQAHMRVHTGEKPFKCSYCEKTFSQRVNLRVHERIHTGEKPYKCEECEECFATTKMLKNHKMKPHNL